MKGTIYQEEIIINIYAPNHSTPDFIKKAILDIKVQINPNTIIVAT
jgi:hypothetical protein